MHQLGSAEVDAERWKRDPEEGDTTIRTGAVIAMPKAVFEGGETFALNDERKLLHQLRQSQLSARSLLRSNIPDRSHLVREAARTLWASLAWHFKFFTVYTTSSDRYDSTVSASITRLSNIDEALLPDGETPDLPFGSVSASVTSHFFAFLSVSSRFDIQLEGKYQAGGPFPSEYIATWDDPAQNILAQLREQDLAGKSMLHDFSRLINQWKHIRVLRSYFAYTEEDLGREAPRTILITRCREALLEVQKITAGSDVQLSIFQPMITLVKVDATLLLALHLLAQSRSNDYNDSHEWHEIRSLISTSLLLVWTQTSETDSTRLGNIQSWRKSARQLIEQILLEAFNRKQAALEHQPRVKREDGESPAAKQDDRLNQDLGPLNEDDPLRAYQEELLADDPIYKHGLFFETLDGGYSRCTIKWT